MTLNEPCSTCGATGKCEHDRTLHYNTPTQTPCAYAPTQSIEAAELVTRQMPSADKITAPQPRACNFRAVWYRGDGHPWAALLPTGHLMIYDPMFAAENPAELDAAVKVAASALAMVPTR